jgi:hypothetical protein
MKSPSRTLLSSLSLLVFALVALVCLMPSAVKADHEEYGTVIGEWLALPSTWSSMDGRRSGDEYGAKSGR